MREKDSSISWSTESIKMCFLEKTAARDGRGRIMMTKEGLRRGGGLDLSGGIFSKSKEA